jgi:hypothetical protein
LEAGDHGLDWIGARAILIEGGSDGGSSVARATAGNVLAGGAGSFTNSPARKRASPAAWHGTRRRNTTLTGSEYT